MSKSIEVSPILLGDLLDFYRLADEQAMLLARIFIGNSGDIAANLLRVNEQLDAVRHRIADAHQQERWNLALKLGSR